MDYYSKQRVFSDMGAPEFGSANDESKQPSAIMNSCGILELGIPLLGGYDKESCVGENNYYRISLNALAVEGSNPKTDSASP